MLSSGAGARGVPWARAPRPLAAHAPGAQRRLTAAPGPAAPQTGSGRLALTEAWCPQAPTRPPGGSVARHTRPLPLRKEAEAARAGEKQAVLSRCSRQLGTAGDIWAARRAGLGLLAGWAPLTQTAEAAWGAGARAGRLAWGCKAQARQPVNNRWKSLVAGLAQADALRAERSIQGSGRRGGLGRPGELRQGNIRRPDSRPGDQFSESPLEVPSSALASPFLLARQHGDEITAGSPLAAAVPHCGVGQGTGLNSEPQSLRPCGGQIITPHRVALGAGRGGRVYQKPSFCQSVNQILSFSVL